LTIKRLRCITAYICGKSFFGGLKMNRTEKDLERTDEDGFVICACGCGKPTEVKLGIPIDLRFYETDGGGTLRKECWEKIYGKS
jgi:hypothetical protein